MPYMYVEHVLFWKCIISLKVFLYVCTPFHHAVKLSIKSLWTWLLVFTLFYDQLALGSTVRKCPYWSYSENIIFFWTTAHHEHTRVYNYLYNIRKHLHMMLWNSVLLETGVQIRAVIYIHLIDIWITVMIILKMALGYSPQNHIHVILYVYIT